MIGLETIRENIQTTLNANQFGKVFRLYTNDGEFRKAFRDGNDITEYINGICRVSNSSLTPLKSLSILTMNVEVEFCIRVDNLEKDANGNYIEVLNIEALCENFVNSQNGQTITLTEEDKTYVLAVNTEMPIVGVERLVTPLGKCLPITLQIFYTMVENGVNSSNVSLYIGGEEVPYTDLTIDRVFVNTVAQKATEEVGKTINEQNSVSISFVAPLTTTALGKDYTDIILDGGNNVALPVTIDYKSLNKKANYTMTFSSLKHTSSGVQNVGVQGTLVEVDTNVADFKTLNIGKWTFGEAVINKQYADQYVSVSIPTQGKYFIDWGDDTIETGINSEEESIELSHNYANSENYVIFVFTQTTINVSIFIYNRLLLPRSSDFTVVAKVGDEVYQSGSYVKWNINDQVPELTVTITFSETGTYRIDALTANEVEITNGEAFKMVAGTKIDLFYSRSEEYYQYNIEPKAQTIVYNDGLEPVLDPVTLLFRIYFSYNNGSGWVEDVKTILIPNTSAKTTGSINTTYEGQEYTLNYTITNAVFEILSTSTFDPSIKLWGLKYNYWEHISSYGKPISNNN